MKDNVESPIGLVDLEHVELTGIDVDGSGPPLGATARRSGEGACDLPLCLWWLRQQGRYPAAAGNHRDGRTGGRSAGETGGDAGRCSHQRLPAVHDPEPVVAPIPMASLWLCDMHGYSQMSMPQLGKYAEPLGLVTKMLYACPNVAAIHRLVATNSS
jgi:hypothetical protein